MIPEHPKITISGYLKNIHKRKLISDSINARITDRINDRIQYGN